MGCSLSFDEAARIWKASRYFAGWPLLRTLWILLCPLIIAMHYFGVFCATAMFEILPFGLVLEFAAPSNTKLYWIGLVVSLAAISFVCLVLVRAFRRDLRVHRVVDVELVIGFLASVFAISYIVLTVCYGADYWHRYD